MIIKTLNLIAFGKFQNKTIEISDGLNLVFGANEAGKTTIQHFIEGMFFGFYKPYRKKRSYSDDYYRYKPRFSDKYFGSMVIIDDHGDEIRIERDFLKTRDGVRIFNNLTGEDISSAYPYDPVSKQYLPLGYGDFNAVRYNNTVNVKQMASKSDVNLAKEVNEQLVHMAGDAKDDVSIKNVLDHIREEKAQIGTKTRKRSHYGKTLHEIQDLESTLAESEKTYRQVQSNQNLIQKYKERIDLAQEKCRAFQSQADKDSRKEQRALESRLAELQEEIEDMESWLDQADVHDGADRKKFGQIQTMESSLAAIEERLDLLDDKIKTMRMEKEDSDQRCQEFDNCLAGMTKKEIEQDYFTYCRLTHQQQESDQTEKRQNHDHSSDYVDFGGISMPALIIGIIAGLIITFAGFINPGKILSLWPQIMVAFLGLVLCLGCLGCLFLKRKADDAFMMSVSYEDAKRDAIFSAETMGNDGAIEIRPEMILQKYGIPNERAYFDFIDRCSSLFNDYESLDQEREKINDRIEGLLSEKQQLEASKQAYESKIGALLEEANVDSVDAYGEICETSNEVDILRSKLESNKELYDELSKRALMSPDASKNFFLTDQDGEMVKIQEAIEAYQHEMDRLIGENQLLMKNMINPVSIRERIETLKNQIEEYAMDVKACDLAEKFFNSYFRRVHYDQAPDLNLKIGQLLEKITHKYREVRVDDQMNVKVVDPDSGALLSIEQLSGGTVDQIYLALRFGIAEIFDQKQNMPLLLDDPFVQYDDARKGEAVKMLSAISKVKQVLLFTCTADEKRILDEHHFDYIGIGI